MYEWVNGQPALLVRRRDLDLWPGADSSPRDPQVSVHEFEGSSILLVAREKALTTAVPLELGGILLVSATYCDDDVSVSHHLDLVPVDGWKLLKSRFRSIEDEYVLCDGLQAGSDLSDPMRLAELAKTSGGLVPVVLSGGNYEVEVLGPWHPDERTELYLTRLVRESQSGMTPLDP